MVVKHRNFEYDYVSDARQNRTDEFLFMKKFILILLLCYLFSSIWIYFFIFIQAQWEQRANIEDAEAYAAAGTWKWWMVFVVILSDIFAAYMLQVIVQEKPKSYYPYMSMICIVYSIVALSNVFLRGSIVAFVFPFAIGTYTLILWYFQRKEDEEHEITQGLRLRETPSMDRFLDN